MKSRQTLPRDKCGWASSQIAHGPDNGREAACRASVGAFGETEILLMIVNTLEPSLILWRSRHEAIRQRRFQSNPRNIGADLHHRRRITFRYGSDAWSE